MTNTQQKVPTDTKTRKNTKHKTEKQKIKNTKTQNALFENRRNFTQRAQQHRIHKHE